MIERGRKDGMWNRGWVPPGGKTDLYSYLKDKLRGFRRKRKAEKEFEERFEERFGKMVAGRQQQN